MSCFGGTGGLPVEASAAIGVAAFDVAGLRDQLIATLANAMPAGAAKLAGGLGHDSEPAKGLAGEVELCRHQGPGNDDAGLPCS